MAYEDRIYGRIVIDEPVIIDLINSPPLQRLKGIDQAGYLKPYFPGMSLTRFEHSVGVYILLNKFGASVEEQAAGLIHDISHSAFSHCIDYVAGLGSEKSHDHQDNIFADFVKKTNIPRILEKYRIDLDYVLDEKNFPLKEKPLPDLCADRIDYSLRTGFAFRVINYNQVKYFLDNLSVKNKLWVFRNYESAKKYADLFYFLNKDYFSSVLSAVMFKTVGDYLSYALSQGYISYNDLYQTDREVLDKVGLCLKKDKKLQLLFARMNNKTKFENNDKDYDMVVYCKSRVVDPLFMDRDTVRRVSEVDKKWVNVVKSGMKPKKYYLKFQ
jgi:hypothetical protein